MLGLYVSASGAQAFSERMEVLSNNISNAGTTGFKREFAVMKARPAESIVEGRDFHGSGSLNNVGGGVQLMETKTDFSPGSLRSTGVKTDMALTDEKGDMFFVVEKNQQKFLTRAGNFLIDDTGLMRTNEGYSLLSSDGAPVRVNPAFPITVTEGGRITQEGAGTNIAVAIERPDSLDELRKVSSALFRTSGYTTPVDPSERNVKQGLLEYSSSNPVQEMIDLIEVTRGYEANVKMIQQHDSATGSLVNRVLGGS